MTPKKPIFSTTALALCLTPFAAAADVTPAQVWNDLETYMQSFGYSVTATETAQGGTLRVTDVVVSIEIPEDDGAVSFSMSEVILAPTGDGAVAVTFPASMPLTLDIAPPYEDAMSMVIDYTHEGLEMIVSGDPDAMTYAYSADILKLALADLVVDEETIPREMFRFDMTFSQVTGRSVSEAAGEMRDIAQSMTAGSVAYDMAFNDPDEDTTGLFAGTLSQVSFEGTSTLPASFSAAAMEDLIASGIAGDGTFRHQGNAVQFAVAEGDEATSGRFSSEAGALAVTVSGEALRYDLSGRNVAFNLAGSDIPLPVDAQMQELGLTLDMPMAASETPEDVALALTLGGFSMSDLLWNIFDPAKLLPRDPATVAIDLAGKVTPFVSLYDADALAQLEQAGGVPGELNALTLNGLTVDVAGVRLTGTGGFTFDNSDLQSFDGLPRPTGSVDFNLTGANALIDKLIEMGLVQESDAMGARMMMGMFTVPGTGPDDLNSKLEINEQGHILANGQRIQ